jgi:hypothetical protein
MKLLVGIDIAQDHVWEICQSLYRLKQAVHDWYELCSDYLKQSGFDSILSDLCVFIYCEKCVIIGLYVDDLFILSWITDKIHEFGKQLSNCFKVKDLGEVKRILGICIT